MKTNKKKIAILYSGGRFFGGIEQYLFNLFNESSHVGCELSLLSLGEWQLNKKMVLAGHKVEVFSGKRISLQTIKNIGRFLKENGYDLLVSQGVVANFYARLITLFYKIPNLVTVHSDISADYAKFLPRFIYKTVDRILRPLTCRYIVVSKYLKKQLIKSGVNKSKIKVIYNGLEFRNPKEKAHKRLVIGSVGRLHPVKGYDLLLKAFSQMDNKRLRLKIAGMGDELDNLKVLAKDLKIEDRVEFVGFKNDIYEFLDTIDVYIQTSRSEGFGLSVIEAMSQNLPVVVTPAGSLVELIKDGVTGYISADFETRSIATALARAVDDYAPSKKVGENGRRFVIENFDKGSWLESTINEYERAAR